MAMASFSSQTNSYLHGHHNGHAKITKARSRTAVKPILKKLQSHSHSEKNSLDLDRSWDEQAQFGYSNSPIGAAEDDPVGAGGFGPPYTGVSTTGSAYSRPARDVSFSLSASDLSNGGPRTKKYSHTRSTSGTSHVSVATSASAGRNGSFVHPFQQTPRTSTPPLSYAASLASLDNPIGPRDYSPTITEDDDDVNVQLGHSTPRAYSVSHSHSQPRRPSLASQRTSSLSDVNQPGRVTGAPRTSTTHISRKPPAIVTRSRSDLQLDASFTTPALDSPSSVSPPGASYLSHQKGGASSSSPGSALSPLRTSLDMNGFRIRSRSEVDTATRQEQVREARRKFEEKERAKEEKYAREEMKKQERAESKDHRLGKSHSHSAKGSFGASRTSCDRTSSHTDLRPSFSRKNTGNGLSDNEKIDFATRRYDTVATGQTPNARADGVQFQSTRRNNTTKRKTTSTWTAFVLWFRTRLLKMGRR